MTWSSRIMTATIVASLVVIAGNVVASQESLADGLVKVSAIATCAAAALAAAVVARASSAVSQRVRGDCYASSGLCMASAGFMAGVAMVNSVEWRMCLAACSAVAALFASCVFYYAKTSVEDLVPKLTASFVEKQQLTKVTKQLLLMEATCKQAQKVPNISRGAKDKLDVILTYVEHVQESVKMLESTPMTGQERLNRVARLKDYLEYLYYLCFHDDLEEVLSLVEIECLKNRCQIVFSIFTRLEDGYNTTARLVRV